MMFHITDAPPHGKEYTTGDDNHPGGCPCKITLDEIATNMSELGIEYVLLKIGGTLDAMEKLFKQKFLEVQAVYAKIEVAAGLDSFYSKEFLAFESRPLGHTSEMESITTEVFKGKVAKYSKAD